RRLHFDHHSSMIATTWPSATGSFSLTRISFTVPPSSVMTGISIFMDSMTISVSPLSTLSPGLALSCHTVPVISDLTSMRAMTVLLKLGSDWIGKGIQDAILETYCCQEDC